MTNSLHEPSTQVQRLFLGGSQIADLLDDLKGNGVRVSETYLRLRLARRGHDQVKPLDRLDVRSGQHSIRLLDIEASLQKVGIDVANAVVKRFVSECLCAQGDTQPFDARPQTAIRCLPLVRIRGRSAISPFPIPPSHSNTETGKHADQSERRCDYRCSRLI